MMRDIIEITGPIELARETLEKDNYVLTNKLQHFSQIRI